MYTSAERGFEEFVDVAQGASLQLFFSSTPGSIVAIDATDQQTFVLEIDGTEVILEF